MKNLSILMFLALPFGLRLAIVLSDFESIVRTPGLLEDDSFYYLNIARHLAAGGGFTADGTTPTTGFQPLHLLLTTLLTLPFDGRSQVPFRLILTVQVLLTAAAAFLLHRLLRRIQDEATAWTGAVLFAWWVPVLRYGNNGMETPLVVLFLLLLLGQTVKGGEGYAAGASWLPSLVAAGAVFARIDMLIPAVGCALALVLLGGRAARLPAAKLTAGAVLGLCAILGMNMAINGHALPDSGEAVGALSRLYAASAGGPLGPTEIVTALLAAAGRDHPLAQVLRTAGVPGWIIALGIAGLLAVAVGRARRGGTASAGWRLLLAVAGVSGAGYLVLYSAVAPGYWFFGRYLFPFSLLLLIFVAPLPNAAVRRAGERLRLRIRPLLGAGAVVYAATFLLPWRVMAIHPADRLSGERDGAGAHAGIAVCHNIGIARWLASSVPESTTVAMWQGGLVAYLVPQRVIHLDGVVNRPALEAWSDGVVDSFVRSAGVDLVVDFRSVARFILARSRSPGASFEPAGAWTCPSGEEIVAYRVRR